MNITRATASTTISASRTALAMNAPPSAGEMESVFTMESFTGSDPVIRMVCSRFISRSAFWTAASSLTPLPEPEISMSVTALPLRSAPMFSASTFSLSRNRSSCWERYPCEPVLPGKMVRFRVSSAWRPAAHRVVADARLEFSLLREQLLDLLLIGPGDLHHDEVLARAPEIDRKIRCGPDRDVRQPEHVQPLLHVLQDEFQVIPADGALR